MVDSRCPTRKSDNGRKRTAKQPQEIASVSARSSPCSRNVKVPTEKMTVTAAGRRGRTEGVCCGMGSKGFGGDLRMMMTAPAGGAQSQLFRPG